MSKITTYKKKAASTLLDGKNYVLNNPIVVLKGVGVLVGVYLGYKFIKGASNKVDSLFNDNFDTVVDNTGQGSTENATITDAQATNFASQLLVAFNRTFLIYGTDTDTISKIFKKLKTPDDFLLVYRAFGTKTYNGQGSAVTGTWDYLDFDIFHKNLDLVGWLKAELNSFYDKSVYNQVKAVVEPAGFIF